MGHASAPGLVKQLLKLESATDDTDYWVTSCIIIRYQINCVFWRYMLFVTWPFSKYMINTTILSLYHRFLDHSSFIRIIYHKFLSLTVW